jgi:hypothetical protein
LKPGAAHVLTVRGEAVTSFTTSPSYDKQQGTPPSIQSLRFWRVRYPRNEIQGGGCVFAEFHGLVAIDWQPASIPNTVPDGTLYTLTLYAKTGGSLRTYLFTRAVDFHGYQPVARDYLPIGPWHPDLDPEGEYCARLTAQGDGDLAR